MGYYKVDGGALIPAPKNIVLPNGSKVFNFDSNTELLAAYGYTNNIVDGEATTPYEWYEQDGMKITRHPAAVIESDDIDDSEALQIILDGIGY